MYSIKPKCRDEFQFNSIQLNPTPVEYGIEIQYPLTIPISYNKHRYKVTQFHPHQEHSTCSSDEWKDKYSTSSISTNA